MKPKYLANILILFEIPTYSLVNKTKRVQLQLVSAFFDLGVETYFLLSGSSFPSEASLFAIFRKLNGQSQKFDVWCQVSPK